MRAAGRRVAAVTLAATLCASVVACGREATVPPDGAAPVQEGPVGTGGVEGEDQEGFADLDVELVAVARVDKPVAMAARPGTRDLFLAEQSGAVRRLAVEPVDGGLQHVLDAEPVLDLSDRTRARGEQGLLGLAFSPDGATLYVNFTDMQGDTRVVAYRMVGDRADPGSERELLRVEQPFPNHNGGQLVVGPDDMLYVGMGDGGSAGDPQNRSQDPDDLLGKILRIDPNGSADGRAYTIPPDNPFIGGGARPEIWISGVRNPWRFGFDRETGDLWIADVGQDEVEEITLLPSEPGGAGRGANLGWPYLEGDRPFRGSPAPDTVLSPPIFTYARDGGNCSVTGGYVYRGTAIPGLSGAYVFGDFCAAEIRALTVADGQVTAERNLGVSVAANSLASFGQDLSGELYVLSLAGTVYRIQPV